MWRLAFIEPMGDPPMPSAVKSDPYQDPNSIESRFRRRRFETVLELVGRTLKEKGRCTIMDIGGTETYWSLGRDEISKPGVRVHLCNLTAPEVANTDLFVTMTGDATDMAEHADNSFDLVHSNSVVEHVGDWTAMKRMAANVRRLAPRYYVQTPYFWFPMEPHFRSIGFHWLPEQMRYRRLMKRDHGFTRRSETIDQAMSHVQRCVLLDKGQMRSLFPDAELMEEKLMGLTKSLMAVRTGN